MKWPWQKKNAPKKRGYAAARLDRTVADWITMATSADSEIKGDLPTLRARSRQLGRDNDYVRAALRDLQVNVIGRGVGLQAQVRKQRGKDLDETINNNIEQLWNRWKRKQYCDVSGKLGFADIERQLIRSVAESGEVFVRKITQSFGGSKVPFALEVIEADMLDDQLTGRSPAGNQIRMGVEVDQWMRPVAYWFLRVHPGDIPFNASAPSGAKHRVIQAAEIEHLMIRDRINQNRGVPWLVSAMTRLRHMGGYEEATVISARASASLMGFIETPEGELQGDDVVDGQRVSDFEPGQIKQLNPGEKMNIPDFGEPNAQFDPFMRAMLRGVAAGIGSSYEAISSDYSQSNYSSSRLALLSVRDFYRIIQDWMIESFHQPIFEAWLDMAVLSGALSLAKFDQSPEVYYEACKWQPRGWQWVDPSKDVQASRDAVAAGFMTQSDVVASMGGDMEELVIQRKREVELAEAAGLKFETEAGAQASGGFQSSAKAEDHATSA